VMEQTLDAPGVRHEKGEVGGVPGVWCWPNATSSPGAAILHLHGGAYVLGIRCDAGGRAGRGRNHRRGALVDEFVSNAA
jgi:acetyl esterase/lipase